MDDQTQDQQNIPEETGEEVPADTEASVQQELDQLKNLAAQFENSYKRALADYQNLQRRTQNEKAEWIRLSTRDFILKLLPVFDTLSLATKHLSDKGLTLSIDQFLKVLQDEGITKINAIGQDFDPALMEVVTTQEVDKKEKGKVIDEIRAGFMYYDTILRPAQVVVGA